MEIARILRKAMDYFLSRYRASEAVDSHQFHIIWYGGKHKCKHVNLRPPASILHRPGAAVLVPEYCFINGTTKEGNIFLLSTYCSMLPYFELTQSAVQNYFILICRFDRHLFLVANTSNSKLVTIVIRIPITFFNCLLFLFIAFIILI